MPGVVSCPGIVAAEGFAEDVMERDGTKGPEVLR